MVRERYSATTLCKPSQVERANGATFDVAPTACLGPYSGGGMPSEDGSIRESLRKGSRLSNDGTSFPSSLFLVAN